MLCTLIAFGAVYFNTCDVVQLRPANERCVVVMRLSEASTIVSLPCSKVAEAINLKNDEKLQKLVGAL